MTYMTDERLKSYLDTNQLLREQMCLAILSLDKRFSDVRPRHPRGGPDGGRDIEALFRKEHRAYAAVGFVNQAADTAENKRTIGNKFSGDVDSAISADPRPAVFVFLTNINLTAAEKSALVGTAKARGFIEAEIFDRERLRITLDSPDGLAARFQYLGIPLSEAEQASFFARWGDDINSVIATGFQEVHRTLDHLLFLQESYAPISGFHVRLELDRDYPAAEIGHFRAFCSVHLKEPKLNIFSILFGASDKSERFRQDIAQTGTEPKGIMHGIGAGQWIRSFPTEQENAEIERYRQVGSSSGIGRDPVRWISISYSTDSFIRFEPVLSLRDFDDCMFMPMLNRSLAERVVSLHVISNGYKLLEVDKTGFNIDGSEFEPDIPTTFDSSEMADPWVRVRPKRASAFHLSFSDDVPVRMYASRQASAALSPMHRKR